jgi:hypothetical protein
MPSSDYPDGRSRKLTDADGHYEPPEPEAAYHVDFGCGIGCIRLKD